MIYRRQHILRKLNNALSYPQKYYLVVTIFAVALTLAIVLLTQQLNQKIRELQVELQANQYQKAVNKLLEDLIHQRMRVMRYHQGNVNLKADILAGQTTILDDFRRLEALNKELEGTLRLREQDLYAASKENLQPSQLSRQWESFKKQILDGDTANTKQGYDDLINNVLALGEYVNSNSSPVSDPELKPFFPVGGSLIELPQNQVAISQLAALNNSLADHKTLSIDERVHVLLLKEKLLENFSKIQRLIDRINPQGAISGSSEGHTSLRALNEAYDTLGVKWLSTIDSIFMMGDELKQAIPIESLDSEAIRLIDMGFDLWDSLSTSFDQILKSLLTRLTWIKYTSLFIGFIIVLAGFLLGQFFIKEVIRSVKNLDDTIHRLTAGDLTARVSILYQDEIGRASGSFNQMADAFERIISQLRNLLDATKRLSDGDFSARVSMDSSTDDEINQVSLSFNNMAQSFEEIISQLHQLGINLTTSATEIATASKQQETIIVEQEATTREISVTASEISTTAKEFANTVNEVSKVGEETSTLASAGKESLSHMESIMRQMVDASGSIASKLAVLNEKAGNITSVITTITKVADQTNLLSLNAAIEAEKAGEFGRSFAVIAREIRRLADQTALATLDIEKIVNEIMSAVSSSVMGVDDFTQEIRNGVDQVGKVGGQLATIIEQVQVLTQRFDSVNQGMQTQSAAAEQINEAMAQLSHTARLTTESIHQFRNTIQQLNSAATDLRVAVSKIKR